MTIHSQVLSLIRGHPAISQSDIRAATGLSASAISNAVKRSVGLGLVREVGLRQESLGRPRTLLSLNGDYGHAIGVQLNSDHNHIVLTNLEGQVVLSEQLRLESFDPQVVAQAVAGFAARAPVQRLVGIGLGVSGIVDPSRGLCLDSTTALGWHDVPIGRIVAERCGIPTALENDANALALAELLFGSARPRESFLVVTLGKGIGAGIILDGRIHRGRGGIAGEIGHTRATFHPTARCYCGKEGCLEAVASGQALARQLGELLGHPVTLDGLSEAVTAAGEAGVRLLQHAGTLLGSTLATLATTFDPDAVYLAFDAALDIPELARATRQSFQSNLLPVSRRPTELRTLTDSDTMWARGASSIAIERFFDATALELASLTTTPGGAAGLPAD